MNRILALIKIDLGTTFRLSAFKSKMRNKNDMIQIIILGIALLSLVPAYFVMVSGLSKIYHAYLSIGQKSMFLLTGILACQIIELVLGILYVMSKYYFSNDLNILVPLPLKPKEIVGAKFLSLLIYEYITMLPLLLPFIIIYGVNENAGFVYWIYSIIILVFLPVIPLSISSIIVMLFMKYTNIKGKKDLLRTIGYIVLIIVMIAFQLKLQSVAERAIANEDFLYKIITDSTILVKKLGIIFPPSMWATLSLSNLTSISGLLYILLFVIASITVFFIMLFLSDNVFFQGLIGNLEVSTSRGNTKVKPKDFKKQYPSYIAIAMKEIRMLIRTPVYLMNSVGGVVLMPILMVMSFIIEGDQSFNMIKMLLGDNQSFVSLIGVGFITILGFLNSVCCTTFSREGKYMWIQRTLPISTKDQIIGRVLSSIFVQVIGIVVMYGSLAYMEVLTLEVISVIALLGLLGSIPSAEIGMIIDAYRPLLNWDNPQKAMKQNLNVVICMGIGGLYVFGAGFLAYKLMAIVDLLIIYGIIAIIFIVSSLILYKPLKKVIEVQFNNLE